MSYADFGIHEIRVGQIHGRPTRPKICVGLVLHVLHGSGAYDVDWILICKICKFGKYICYNFRDTKFFLGGYFFGAPCRLVSRKNMKKKKLKQTNASAHWQSVIKKHLSVYLLVLSQLEMLKCTLFMLDFSCFLNSGFKCVSVSI